MSEIIGVSFPIPKRYVPRFFVEGKTVFIKPATTFKEVKKGIKFIFYQSHEDTGFVGEAIIKEVTLSEDPVSFYGIYGDKVFLTIAELNKYIETIRKWKSGSMKKNKKPREGKWIAIELEHIREYDRTIKPKHFVPVGGLYIKDNIY